MKKRKPGRPPLGDKGRIKAIHVKLKIEEHEWLMNIAKEHNTTVSELLRSAVHQLYDTPQ